MICFYCGVALDDKTVNKQCQENTKEQLDKGFHGFSEKVPDQQFNGSKRHFFGKPLNEVFEGTQVDTQKFGNRNNQKLTNGGSGGGMTTFIQNVIGRVRKVSTDQNLDFVQIFKSHDKDNKGRLNYIQFGYIMTQIFDQQPMDTDKFIRFLDPLNSNAINYQQVLKMLADPSYIETFPAQNAKQLDESYLSEEK